MQTIKGTSARLFLFRTLSRIFGLSLSYRLSLGRGAA